MTLAQISVTGEVLMATISGFIKVHDEVVFDNVEFNIMCDEDDEGVTERWSGSFVIYKGEQLLYEGLHDFYGPLTLVLEDGRSGQFEWTEIGNADLHSRITFSGIGSLK